MIIFWIRYILDDFRQQFLTANPSLEVWRGTSAQLHRILNSDNDRKEAMRSYPILRLSNQLATLEQRGYPIVSEDSGPNRVWTINLKDLEPEPEVVVDVAPQPAPAPKPKAAKVTKKKETANA